MVSAMESMPQGDPHANPVGSQVSFGYRNKDLVNRSRNTRKSATIRLIGIFKVLKAVLLLAIAFGALKLVHRDLADEIRKWLQHWHVDPSSHYFQTIVSKATGIDDKKIALAGIGSFFYATLFLIEGIGLLLLKRWAEIFTVIVTASFIPLEIYHLVRHFSAIKIVVILVNVAIVVYLVRRLKHDKSTRA